MEGVLSSLADSTRRAYRRAASQFVDFSRSAGHSSPWPMNEGLLLRFLACLREQGLSCRTLCVTLAGLSFCSKALGAWDPGRSFLARQAVKGWGRQSVPRPDPRRPITRAILRQLLGHLPAVARSDFELVLFRAAFTAAFHGALRGGELVARSRSARFSAGLMFSDVELVDSGVQCLIRRSKCDQGGKGNHVYLPALRGEADCPRRAMAAYLEIRPALAGPLFVHQNGSCLSRYQFVAVLRACLQGAGLQPSLYGSHSFRIGAATEAYLAGEPARAIQQRGRWRSRAYKLYIRPQHAV
ncbi:integrase/recombinase xerD homolog [Paroedura picta]|uniref:integrase/recombinase xerD homolog n=1 Tax=Paroedura picta TaxID=143630 RepID=UPI0040562CDD